MYSVVGLFAVLELLKNNWGVDHRRPKSRVDSTLWSTEGRKIYWGLNPPNPSGNSNPAYLLEDPLFVYCALFCFKKQHRWHQSMTLCIVAEWYILRQSVWTSE